MLKRYQKKKRKYLHCQMHWGGGGGGQNRKKVKKNVEKKIRFLIMSMCRIYPENVLSFLL